MPGRPGWGAGAPPSPAEPRAPGLGGEGAPERAPPRAEVEPGAGRATQVGEAGSSGTPIREGPRLAGFGGREAGPGAGPRGGRSLEARPRPGGAP